MLLACAPVFLGIYGIYLVWSLYPITTALATLSLIVVIGWLLSYFGGKGIQEWRKHDEETGGFR